MSTTPKDTAAPKYAATLAARQEEAARRFIQAAAEQFGLTEREAGAAFRLLVDEGIVEVDPNIGQFKLNDGRFWNGDVLRRAADANTAE